MTNVSNKFYYESDFQLSRVEGAAGMTSDMTPFLTVYVRTEKQPDGDDDGHIQSSLAST